MVCLGGRTAWVSGRGGCVPGSEGVHGRAHECLRCLRLDGERARLRARANGAMSGLRAYVEPMHVACT